MSDPAPPADRPLDLLPVDISAYTGNTAIPYVTTLDSGIAGPHLLINALTHGNEVCGAHALDYLFRNGVTPTRGRLSLSFANVTAYESFDAANPGASRFVDEDFNRLWSSSVLDGAARSSELARAKELRALIDTVDHLLDLHSMQTPSPPLALAGTTRKCLALCQAMGVPQHIVIDAGHTEGVRLRDYGYFADEDQHHTSVLVECGQHWMAASRDVAIESALRFLGAFDAVDRDWLASRLGPAPDGQRAVEVTDAVTVGSADFQFLDAYQGLEMIAQAGTAIARDGARTIVTPYDSCVLIMPTRRIKRGQTAVRFGRYVNR
ncbi:MAG: succinylglutamate desuccinylase/aspartoacylase family protein [Proteobacteria bacterium]|nr:succinylglutamate desuccinylase/aspartoacylase family protein [Pseudomonadota bacterium]MDA1059214.1 succinylglutamate desuccinylase/aspartoacylase family protein [Pseudomonadota bacterium]